MNVNVMCYGVTELLHALIGMFLVWELLAVGCVLVPYIQKKHLMNPSTTVTSVGRMPTRIATCMRVLSIFAYLARPA